jgi:hypothetical protein
MQAMARAGKPLRRPALLHPPFGRDASDLDIVCDRMV